MKFLFSQNPIKVHEKVVENVSGEAVESTPVLRRPSLENAVMYGGPLMRELLETVPLVGDKNYITVDTKVTLLMPGWYPAIPGWHTDGVPRGEELLPDAKGKPRLDKQSELPKNVPHYHVISVGLDSPTEFVNQPFELDIENFDNSDLYKELTQKVNPLVADGKLEVVSLSDAWVSWDWWNVHRAIPADKTGWRLLIRVTESDVLKPRTKDFIRPQSQVYVPVDFGW